jgi:microcompartment protein CcmL/EutN
MAVLAGLLTLLGMAGAAVALVMLIVQFIFKRGWAKKRIWTVGAVSLALFVVGMVMGVSSVPEGYEAGRQAAQNETAVNKVSTPNPEKEQPPSPPPSSDKLTETTEATAPAKSLQDQQEQKTEAAQAVKNKTEDMLKNIVVTVETQEVYDSKDRQKAVVWVVNKTDHIFSGQLDIMVKSGEFSRGAELFTITDLKPGLRTWGIMWLRTSFMGADTGRGAEPKVTWSNVEFKQPQE